MKTLTSIFLAFFSLNVGATDLDNTLANYVKQFSLKSIERAVPSNKALFQLGRKLFGEREMSGHKNISCMDCHHPQLGTSDAIPLSIGEGGFYQNGTRIEAQGNVLTRNSPTLFNLGHIEIKNLFWDGRVAYDNEKKEFTTPEESLNGANPKEIAITKVLQLAPNPTLAAQVLFPLLNNEEMRGQPGTNDLSGPFSNTVVWTKILERLQNYWPEMVSTYQLNNENELNIGHVGLALAYFISYAFQVTETAYDQYLRGDLNALTEKEKKGLELFITKAACIKCHTGQHLSNFQFESVASPQIYKNGQDPKDIGRAKITGIKRDQYKFKVPALRGLTMSAPYMHSGSLSTIEDVVEHYNNIPKSLRSYVLKKQSFENYQSEILYDNDDDRNRLRQLMITNDEVRRGLNLDPIEKENLISFLKTI
jgi:cytochrome c peroxidase